LSHASEAGDDGGFWNTAEMAARMGERPPDERMLRLLDEEPDLRRVLDAGCAGGRNAAVLAERGLDVHAFDAASAMVAATRERLAPLLGEAEAIRRVRLARAEDPDAWRPDDGGPFDLILALGVLQDLPDAATVRRAIGLAADALRPGGRVLVANFGPDSRPSGTPLEPVPGEPHVYLGFAREERRMTLPDAATLDAWFAAAGLPAEVPTTTARRPTEQGERTTFNGRYRKPPDPPAAATAG
jgi:SAM-dependent methyltransferase